MKIVENMKPLENRTALVTGGGRGIGRAVALELARLGAVVAVLARSQEEIDQTAREISGMGGKAIALNGDVARRADVQAAFQAIFSQAGPVDVLVNNAGVLPLGPLASSDPGEWRYAIEVNLIGAYECLRAVLPGMLERGWGRVVNVSSVLARMPAIQNRGAYVVSKAGLDRLTQAAAAELAGTGVCVNSVYPGITDTAMQEQVRNAPLAVIGEVQHRLIHDVFARGEFHAPPDAARLIAAIALSEMNGALVDLDGEEGRALLQAYRETYG